MWGSYILECNFYTGEYGSSVLMLLELSARRRPVSACWVSRHPRRRPHDHLCATQNYGAPALINVSAARELFRLCWVGGVGREINLLLGNCSYTRRILAAGLINWDSGSRTVRLAKTKRINCYCHQVRVVIGCIFCRIFWSLVPSWSFSRVLRTMAALKCHHH